eukprot:gene13424-biopygen490
MGTWWISMGTSTRQPVSAPTAPHTPHRNRPGIPSEGEMAMPASGPRPVRIRFFTCYSAPRVRSAHGPRPLPFIPGFLRFHQIP